LDYNIMRRENDLISKLSENLPVENDLISTIDDPLVEQINYRGFSFNVWRSCATGDAYTYIAGRLLRIPKTSNSYRKWLEDQIDCGYGLVKAWPEHKAMLVEKPNPEEPDLFLIVDGRTVKVYLITDPQYNKEACVRTVEADLRNYLDFK